MWIGLQTNSVHEQITFTVTLRVIPIAKDEVSFLKDLGGRWGEALVYKGTFRFHNTASQVTCAFLSLKEGHLKLFSTAPRLEHRVFSSVLTMQLLSSGKQTHPETQFKVTKPSKRARNLGVVLALCLCTDLGWCDFWLYLLMGLYN